MTTSDVATPGVPVLGPCVALLPGDHFSLVFPLKFRTASRFDLESLEIAARVCLYDMLPDDKDVDESVAIQITWGQQVIGSSPTEGEARWIAHLVAKLKERTDA